uniref:Uncharacterized protein LOC105138367 n=2 Tax=Rhizophora mucronata TaxID=61149 RepID=A0A2P2JC40_RHIMU
MAKRELSSTLRNLKFMQRAVQREGKRNKEEEDVKPVGNFSSSDIRKCVVIMEGDPHPGAAIGRMSFGSFNPSVDKLNEEVADLRSPEPSGGNTTISSSQSGDMPLRDNRSSLNGTENSNSAKRKQEINGDLKRKQTETEDQNKLAKVVRDRSVSSPYSSEGSFKQPKREKLDWNVLIPKRQNK